MRAKEVFLQGVAPLLRKDIWKVFGLDSVEKGTFYVTISRFVFFLAGYAIYFVLGRFLLTPEQFGVYGIIISLFSVVTTILVTAIQQAVSKFVSEREELAEAVKRTSLKVQFAISTAFFLLFVLLAPAIAFLLNDSSLVPLIQLSGLIFLFHPIFAIFGGCLNGLRKFKKFAGLEISYSVLKMVLVISLVFLGFSVFGAVTGFIIASFLAATIGLLLAGLGKPSGHFPAKKLLLFSLPLFALAGIQNLLLSLDLFSVKALSLANADLLSGYYVAAQTISRIPQFLVLAITTVLFPLVSSTTFKKQAEKTRFYISNSLRYSLLLLVPITAILASNSAAIISLIYSSAYAPGASALSILAIGSLFYSVFLVFVAVISSSGRPKASTATGFIALIALFLLCFLFVPVFSIEGAATASAIACFAAMLLAGGYVFKKFHHLMPIKSFAKIVLAGAIVLALSEAMGFAGGFFAIAKIALLSLAYCAILVLFKEVNKRDLRILAKMVR